MDYRPYQIIKGKSYQSILSKDHGMSPSACHTTLVQRRFIFSYVHSQKEKRKIHRACITAQAAWSLQPS